MAFRAGEVLFDERALFAGEGRVAPAEEHHRGAEAQAALRGLAGGLEHVEEALPRAGAQQRGAHAIHDVVVHGIAGAFFDHAAEGVLLEHRVAEPAHGRRALRRLGCGQQRRDVHLGLDAVRVEGRHLQNRGAGAAVTDQVPHGVRRVALAVDLVQHAPEHVGAHHPVLGHVAAAIAAAEARQVDADREAPQLHKLRHDLAPVERTDQRRGQEHHALDGPVLGRADAKVHANPAEG